MQEQVLKALIQFFKTQTKIDPSDEMQAVQYGSANVSKFMDYLEINHPAIYAAYVPNGNPN